MNEAGPSRGYETTGYLQHLPIAIPPALNGLHYDNPAVSSSAGAIKPVIGEKEIAAAAATLAKYKAGKAALENRVVDDELWWELRHWESLRRTERGAALAGMPQPSSAWLFNAICNKHADAMDNYPESVVLPRERGDEESARTLSSVLPVVMEANRFEQTYSDNWWEKLKHGTAAYGVFWDPEKENGLGDIEIRPVDLLKLFWEPGVTDLQRSANLFIVELTDTKLIERQYPQFAGRLGGQSVAVAQYLYNENVDTSDKSVVVDWYYKRRDGGGRTVLHYAKFVGACLLYASENDPRYAERGFYDHGLYPVVLDVLFPEKGTPVGFGYVAICKDPQMYIDKLSAYILENAMMGTRKRFFVSESTAVNQDEFLDWNEPLVHVAGELGDERIREIRISPPDGIYLSLIEQKIEEMKDTAANRDVNSGGTGSGVTAAAAIAALQEAGNKCSRDMIAASYRAYTRIGELCVELMRQFYDEARSFRVTGQQPGQYEFIEFSNAELKPQTVSPAAGVELYRKPVFDLKIKAQKQNPFSRMEMNERAKELFQMGFYDPARAQETVGALEMMDFEGIEQVRDYARQGETLLNQLQTQQQTTEQLSELLRTLTGQDPDALLQWWQQTRKPRIAEETTSQPAAQAAPAAGPTGTVDNLSGEVMASRMPQTGYMQDIVGRTRVGLR